MLFLRSKVVIEILSIISWSVFLILIYPGSLPIHIVGTLLAFFMIAGSKWQHLENVLIFKFTFVLLFTSLIFLILLRLI